MFWNETILALDLGFMFFEKRKANGSLVPNLSNINQGV
jgi:hypothetical protein